MAKTDIWTVTEDSAAKLKADTDVIKFDAKFPGFGVRVRNGKRTYVYQYKIGSKQRRITLGAVGNVTAKAARDQAGKYDVAQRAGDDPAALRQQKKDEAGNSLGKLITEYLEAAKASMRPRSYTEAVRYLTKTWKPLHHESVGNVTRAMVAAKCAALASQGKNHTANRARSCLSALFVWAIGAGKADDNPVIGSNKAEEGDPRERELSNAEAAAVWLAAPDDKDYGPIVRLLLLTGCRREEIGSLHWSEVNLEARTISLPKERTKNGQAFVVPLSEPAVAVLAAIPQEGRTFVFGRGDTGFSGWSKAKREFDKVLKLAEPWRVHDLRRTLRTALGQLGVAPHVAEACLNHLPAKLIRTYDRNKYEAEKRQALELWANHLKVAIAQATGANVTPLRKA